MEFPDKQQHHIKLRRPGSQRAHPSCRHPQPLTYPRQPNSPNRPKSVCDVNRTGRVNPWRVCLVHSRDVCLLSQALVLFPRSRPPGINKKALYPRAKAKFPPPSAPRFEPCTCCTLPSRCLKSTRVDGAQAAAMKG